MTTDYLTWYSRFSSGRVYYVFDTCVETYFRTTFLHFFSLSVFVLEDHYSPSFLELIESYANLFFLFVKWRFNFVFVRATPLFYRKLLNDVMRCSWSLINNISSNLMLRNDDKTADKTNILLVRWNIYLFCIFFLFWKIFFFFFFPTDRPDFFMEKIRKPTN